MPILAAAVADTQVRATGRAHTGRLSQAAALSGPGEKEGDCHREDGSVAEKSQVTRGCWRLMQLVVPAQVIGLGEGFCAALVRADIGPGSGMDPVVFLQGGSVCEGFAASGVRADKGPFPGMGSVVALPRGSVGEGFATALVQAGKGFLSCVGFCVYVQIAALCEGFATVRPEADKGPFPRVDPVVLAQARSLYEGFATVRMGADKGSVPRMGFAVLVQAGSLPESFSTVRGRTDKGPLCPMGFAVPAQARSVRRSPGLVGPVCAAVFRTPGKRTLCGQERPASKAGLACVAILDGRVTESAHRLACFASGARRSDAGGGRRHFCGVTGWVRPALWDRVHDDVRPVRDGLLACTAGE